MILYWFLLLYIASTSKMIQIPNSSLFKKGNPSTNYSSIYLPDTDYVPIVEVNSQRTVFNNLNNDISKEYFYFTVNIKNESIKNCNGVTEWLGYADPHFDLKKYNQILHPSHEIIQSFYGLVLSKYLIEHNPKLHFMHPIWITILALKHKNGKYIYCKRQCYPFQLSTNNKLLEYLSVFTVIKEYNNESYYARVYDDTHTGTIKEENIKKKLQSCFEQHSNFSTQELRIIKRYAQYAKTTSETVAKAFKIEKATVATYNKRILRKAEVMFCREFENAKEVGKYLSEINFI